MFDDSGQPLGEVPSGKPVEIIGWRELPAVGEDIIEVESEVMHSFNS